MISISFDGELILLRIDGKLKFAYRKTDLGEAYYKEFIGTLLKNFERYLITGQDHFLMRLDVAAHPSIGICNICGTNAHLIGSVCYHCSESA